MNKRYDNVRKSFQSPLRNRTPNSKINKNVSPLQQSNNGVPIFEASLFKSFDGKKSQITEMQQHKKSRNHNTPGHLTVRDRSPTLTSIREKPLLHLKIKLSE